MKMKFSHEQLHEMSEKAGEYFRKDLEELKKEHAADLTLEKVRALRSEMFYKTFDGFMCYLEKEGYSYDHDQIGRYSRYLYLSLQSVWLEFNW